MHACIHQHGLFLFLLAGPLTLAVSTGFAADETRYEYENEQIHLRLGTRNPQQIAAFYEGRGFPRNVIDETGSACFVTIGISNKSQDIIWLDLSKWSFQRDGREIPRISRNDWKQRWQTMKVPLRVQSTFRWTLLPEILDFRPGEREGGNVTIPAGRQSFTLHAVFDTGAKREGPPIEIRSSNIWCPAS